MGSSKDALEGINFRIEKGQTIGLIGQNGAGKTTLLRLLAEIIEPSSGTLLKSDWLSQESSTYLLEQPGLYKHQTSREYLQFFRDLYLSNSSESLLFSESKLQDLCQVFEFDYLSEKAYKLSLGNKQKLQLIRCFWLNRGFMILDEPIANLDPIAQTAFWSLIKADKETTFIISSHHLNDMISQCNKISFIHEGRMIKQMNQQELEEEMNITSSFLDDFQQLKDRHHLPNLEYKLNWDAWYQSIICKHLSVLEFDHKSPSPPDVVEREER